MHNPEKPRTAAARWLARQDMCAAYNYGADVADAVYAGQQRYSLRTRNNKFRLEQIQQGIAKAHACGKKFFLISALLPHNEKVRDHLRDIEPIIAMRPDALIMADPGLIMQVREQWPEVAIHLLVQANYYQLHGREVLAKMRACSASSCRVNSRLAEIEKIGQECSELGSSLRVRIPLQGPAEGALQARVFE